MISYSEYLRHAGKNPISEERWKALSDVDKWKALNSAIREGVGHAGNFQTGGYTNPGQYPQAGNFPGYDPRFVEEYIEPGSEGGGGDRRYRVKDQFKTQFLREGDPLVEQYLAQYGDRVWLDENGKPIEIDDGSGRYVVGYVNDYEALMQDPNAVLRLPDGRMVFDRANIRSWEMDDVQRAQETDSRRELQSYARTVAMMATPILGPMVGEYFGLGTGLAAETPLMLEPGMEGIAIAESNLLNAGVMPGTDAWFQGGGNFIDSFEPLPHLEPTNVSSLPDTDLNSLLDGTGYEPFEVNYPGNAPIENLTGGDLPYGTEMPNTYAPGADPTRYYVPGGDTSSWLDNVLGKLPNALTKLPGLLSALGVGATQPQGGRGPGGGGGFGGGGPNIGGGGSLGGRGSGEQEFDMNKLTKVGTLLDYLRGAR